ncbi:hypothetical protein FDI40_gp627 [Agrobacterium phage Atu_ph07]|uniref:Terminase large subunit n=1 Tax=Agrobacterium phage Atu_ph07 TaxID=2024264 RepID=A0A2L0V0U8_9CAUD|nr:hypothetical protein FDI40_gp627 [Agrobacterium phage Atu_ph07]AUZ95386.1 hypothetical protein [Agrobacterium phage Atu_ph07]
MTTISRYDCLLTTINYGKSPTVDDLITDSEKIYQYLNQLGETRSIRDFYQSLPSITHYKFQEETLTQIDGDYHKNYLITGRQVGSSTIGAIFALHRAVNKGDNVYIVCANAAACSNLESLVSNLYSHISESYNGHSINHYKGGGNIHFVSSSHSIPNGSVIIINDLTNVRYADFSAMSDSINKSKKFLAYGCLSKDDNNPINQRLTCGEKDTFDKILPSHLRVDTSKIRNTVDPETFKREYCEF